MENHSQIRYGSSLADIKTDGLGGFIVGSVDSTSTLAYNISAGIATSDNDNAKLSPMAGHAHNSTKSQNNYYDLDNSKPQGPTDLAQGIKKTALREDGFVMGKDLPEPSLCLRNCADSTNPIFKKDSIFSLP